MNDKCAVVYLDSTCLLAMREVGFFAVECCSYLCRCHELELAVWDSGSSGNFIDELFLEEWIADRGDALAFILDLAEILERFDELLLFGCQVVLPENFFLLGLCSLWIVSEQL